MKLFRRIAALALAVAVVAMFGISASAASASVPGDFGVNVGAEFSWYLTTSRAWADAVFHDGGNSDIDLKYQHIVIAGNSVSQDSPYIYRSVDDDKYVYGDNNYTVGAYAIANPGYNIQYATYTYDAYYVANGVVHCYPNYGPVRLNNP